MGPFETVVEALTGGITAAELKAEWNEVSAEEYGVGDDRSIPREWREEALYWQADETPENLRDAVAEANKQLRYGLDGDDPDERLSAIRSGIALVHGKAWYAEQKRRESEALDAAAEKRDATRQLLVKMAAAVEAAIPGINFTEARGGSWYAEYRNKKLRISDHFQKHGGGFNQGTGERMGEAAVEWVLEPGDRIPSRTEIRNQVAKAFRGSY